MDPIVGLDVSLASSASCVLNAHGKAIWRQVLEYFDASTIGLTATPSKHTLGFFNQNLVAEYPTSARSRTA